MKSYMVNTDGVELSEVHRCAEDIADLAHSIQTDTTDFARAIQCADAIMHLAADIKYCAELNRGPQ